MPTVLDTFITRFGFETDESGLDDAKGAIDDFKTKAVKVFGIVGAVLGGGALINNIADAADETLKFADSVGVAVEEVGAFEFVVKRQGGSVEGFRGSLQAVNKVIGEVSRGTGEAKEVLETYGISIKNANGKLKTADEIMLDLNKAFSGLSKAKQFDLAAKMGIDNDTIKLLQTAPEEVGNLLLKAKELGVVSRQEAEAAAAFNDGLTDISQSLKKIGFAAGAVLFKPLAAFFKLIARGTSFIRKHSQFIGVFLGVLALLNAQFIVLKINAALAWVATFAPIIGGIALILALSAAIALLVEDVVAFFKGQDSLLGDALEKWPQIGKAIKNVIESAKFFGKIIKEVFITAIKFYTPFIDKLWKLVKLLGRVAKFTGGKISAGLAALDENFLAPAPVTTQSSFAGGSTVGDTTTSVSVGEIKIDAKNGDSQEIAQNVDAKLRDQLQNTVQDFNSGIKK